MKINIDWHNTHKMPKNPTEEERAKWHIEHQISCACRKPSEKESALIEKYKSK